MIARPPQNPVCSRCEKELGPTAPRVFQRAVWYCGDCFYRLEYGDQAEEESVRSPKRPRAKRKQTETLF